MWFMFDGMHRNGPRWNERGKVIVITLFFTFFRGILIAGFDTPTARSGGILASLRTACRSRSYTRSTSVYTLGMPYREQYSYSLVSDVFRRIMISIMPDPTTRAFPDSIR